MLNTEFDQLEESNKDIREQIAKIVERGQMSNQEKVNLEKSLAIEAEMLLDDIKQKMNEAQATKEQLKKIQ